MEKITRRQFGEILAAAGVLVLAGCTPTTRRSDSIPSPTTRPTEKEDPTGLIQEIAQKYGVDLVPYDIMVPAAKDGTVFGPYPKWTTERVKMIKTFFDFAEGNGLPKSYYTPDDRGRLRIALTQNGDPSECCGEFENLANHPRDIKLSVDYFNTQFPDNAYRDLLHEVTHNQTYLKRNQDETGEFVSISSTYFEEITTILNFKPPIDKITQETELVFTKNLQQLRDPQEVLQALLQKHAITYTNNVPESELRAKLGTDWEEYSFLYHYIYGTTNLQEYIAVMGESYAYGGEEYFISHYAEFLGHVRAKNLCSFLKTNFFKDWTPPWEANQKPPFKAKI